ncbi:MAG: DUF481 domain-containing protein [Porticoccaceae bacterium]|nr:DUF481 domain-containing protein [Porticoccaceae bacterium]
MGLFKFCRQRQTVDHILVLISLAMLLIGLPAMADELIMKDGSRLLGSVVSNDGNDTIEFTTTYAGVIKVKWAEVDELKSDKPVIVLLKNAQVRKITGAKNTEAGIVTSNASGLSETIPTAEVAHFNPEPWRLGEGWNWTGHTNAVLNYERGNSEKDQYATDVDMTFRKIDDRFKFYGDYDREKSNDVLTDDDWRLSGRYDHFVDKKLYYGGKLGLEHDRFADLRLRSILGPVVGYEFYQSTLMNLDVAGGPMYVDEDFYDADNRDYVAFGWNLEFDRYLITDRVQFYHRHRGLLEVEAVENLVWDAWTGFRFPIYAGIMLSTELLLEYDGGASDGIDKTDTTYNVKLGYKW